MSEKNLDKKGRFRSKVIAFRLSPEENAMLNRLVALSGLTKQDFIIANLFDYQLQIRGSSRIYNALKKEFAALKSALETDCGTEPPSDEFIEVLKFALRIYEGMKE